MLSPVVTHPLLDVAVDDFRSPVKADLRSIDGQLIVAAVAPLLLAVEVMVQLAALVIFWIIISASSLETWNSVATRWIFSGISPVTKMLMTPR